MENEKIRFKTIYTDDEIAQFEDIALEMFLDKKNKAEIASFLDITDRRMKGIEQRLIEQKLITQKLLDKLAGERAQEEMERRIMTDPYLKVIIDGLTIYGKSNAELSKETKHTARTIKKIVEFLLNKGKIKQSQIDSAKIARKEREKKEKEEKNKSGTKKLDEREQAKLLRMLYGGIIPDTIKKRLGIDLKEFTSAKETLFRKNKITREMVKERRKVKIARLEKRICYLANKKGYTLPQMVKSIRYEQASFIGSIIRKLKREGKIEDKNVSSARNAVNKVRNFIYDCLKDGFLRREIVEAYEMQYKGEKLTLKRVENYEKKLIQTGDIIKDDLEAKREIRRKQKAEQEKLNNRGIYDDKICELIQLGFYPSEITNILGFINKGYIHNRLKFLVLQGKLTDYRMGVPDVGVREQASVERMTRINASEEMTDEERAGLINTQITYTRAKIRLGETISNDEIKFYVDTVSKSNSEQGLYIANSISRAFVKDGKNFIAKQFLNSCKSNCSDSEMKKKLEQGVKEIDKYVAKKRAEKQKAIRVNAINKMIESERDVVTPKLLEHIDYVREDAKAGKAKRSDVNLIGQAIVLNGDLVTEENVSLILGEYLKNGRLEDASDFINRCMTIVSDNDKKFAMVYGQKRKLDYEINKRKAEDLIRNGENSNEKIKHITGIMDIDIIAARRKVEAEKKDVSRKAKAVKVAPPGTPVDDGR